MILQYTDILDDKGRLRPDKVEDILVEVVSGKFLFTVHGVVHATRYPTPQEFDTARLFYSKRLVEARQAGLMTRAEIEERMASDGLIDPGHKVRKQNLQLLMKRLSESRDAAIMPEDRIRYIHEIERTSSELGNIVATEEIYYRNSAEAKAEEDRHAFLTFSCSLTGELLDAPLWKSWSDFQACQDVELVVTATEAQMRVLSGLPVTVIRALARTQEWRLRWRAAKETGAAIFDGPSSAWDPNKLNVSAWSNYFDSILSHPECPGEELIQNDRELEIWVNAQVAKANRARAKSGVGSRGGSVTFRDGKGRAMQSQNLGTTKINVQTPVAVRK